MDFENKVVIVTGAAQGVGKAITDKFATEGAKVIALDINGDQVKSVYEGVDSVLAMKCDVTSEEDWAAVASTCIEKFGRIDVLVNNAAIFVYKGLEEISVREFDRVMKVNVDGALIGIRAVVDHMKDNGGAIVNINSVACLRSGSADAGQVAYGASKNALRGLSRFTAFNLAKYGIRVNSVFPGAIRTPAYEEYLRMNPAFVEAAKNNSVLPPHAADPEDIADAVLFLASEKARCITGGELVVDCGVMTH